MTRLYYRVDLNASCGAQHHPAFSKAVHRPQTAQGRLTLYFLLGNKDLLKGKYRQQDWAKDKVQHLRAFAGSEPKIYQMLDGNMSGAFWIDPDTNTLEERSWE